MESRRKPLVLFTGFLGAGKTTLITQLMKSKPVAVRAALIETDYVVNFGLEPAIIGPVLQSTVWSFAGGCVCCSNQGELRDTIATTLRGGDFDVLLIELTGLSFVTPILPILSEFDASLELALIVGVVDCSAPPSLAPEADEQLGWADVVIANKSDLGRATVPPTFTGSVFATVRGNGFDWQQLETEMATRAPRDVGMAAAWQAPQSHSVNMASLVPDSALRFHIPTLVAGLARLDCVRGKAILRDAQDGRLRYLQFVRGKLTSQTLAAPGTEERNTIAAIGHLTRRELHDALLASQAVMWANSTSNWCIRPYTHAEEEPPIDWNALVPRVFATEPLCAAYPPPLAGPMFAELAAYASYCATKDLTVVARHCDTGVLGAFSLCKEFSATNSSATISLGPIDALLAACQSGLSVAILQERVLHVAIIGRTDEAVAAPGLMKAVLLHSLRLGYYRGFRYAFAETSSPQSTHISCSTGAVIRKTVPYASSDADYICNIPAWLDRNSDVVSTRADGLVAPSMRLVVWDLREVAAAQHWE